MVHLKKYPFILLLCIFIMQSFPVRAAVKEIKYQAEVNYPPLKYMNNGRLSGFDIELTSLIFKNEDYRVSITTDSWDKTYQKLKDGDIDTCGFIVVNEERQKDVLFSNMVMDTHISIYTRSNFNKVTLNDLGNYSVGVGKSQYSESILRNNLKLSNYKQYDDVSQAVDALAKGEIDVLFENQEVVNHYIINKDLKGTLVQQATDLFTQKIAYGVKKSNPELVQYINKRLKELQKSGAYEELYEKYFFTHSEFYRQKQNQKYIILSIVLVAALILLYLTSQFYIKFLRKKIYEEVSYSNEVLNNSNLFSMAVNPEGRIVKLNKYGEYLLGLNFQDISDKYIYELTDQNRTLSKLNEMLLAFQADKEALTEISLDIEVNNKELALLFRLYPLYNKENEVDYIVMLGVDITERIQYEDKLQQQYMELEATFEELAATEEELRAQYDELMESQARLEESESRYRTILESTSDGIWELDTKNNKLFISSRFAEMLGLDQKTFNNSNNSTINWYNLLHPEDKEYVFDKYRSQELLAIDTIQFESRMQTNSGNYKWFLNKSKNLRDIHGHIYKKIGAITDIDDLKMYQQQLHYNAYYDTLTGLPNRLYLYENVASDIVKSVEAQQNGALIFIDLDNFKIINDTFGHSTGDILLQKTAEKLCRICPGKNNIIRLGGDEFIIVLNNINSVQEVEQVAKKLIDSFNEPFNLEELVVTSTLSIGICLFPKDGEDLGTLLKNADTAMYKSKNAGRNSFAFYDESMSKNLIDRINLETNLKSALKNNEFKLYYQPQLDLLTGKITGLEALIRWDNPQLGRVPPDKFISAAEEMGLIIPIGEWVLKTACEFLLRLHKEGIKDLRMSVNISIVQLIQNNFSDIVLKILSESGLDAKHLELEITETVLMENIGNNIEKLEMLTSKGLRVALDDFGKGYSSLNYLKSLPISTLKIDKSFMDDVLTDSYTEAIVSSIMLIGNKMGLTLVAEGIEDPAQLEYLKYSGCNVMQGYLLSKPLPEEEMIEFLS